MRVPSYQLDWTKDGRDEQGLDNRRAGESNEASVLVAVTFGGCDS